MYNNKDLMTCTMIQLTKRVDEWIQICMRGKVEIRLVTISKDEDGKDKLMNDIFQVIQYMERVDFVKLR